MFGRKNTDTQYEKNTEKSFELSRTRIKVELYEKTTSYT